MRIKDYWPAILWAFIIFILTIAPSNQIPEPPDWGFSIDKVVHFLIFMVLNLLLLFTRHVKDRTWNQQQLIQIIILLSTYGFILELLQILVPARNFSWFDLAANVMGVIAGNFIYLGIVKLKKMLVNR
jgi:VanZ family protein